VIMNVFGAVLAFVLLAFGMSAARFWPDMGEDVMVREGASTSGAVSDDGVAISRYAPRAAPLPPLHLLRHLSSPRPRWPPSTARLSWPRRIHSTASGARHRRHGARWARRIVLAGRAARS
jgi:hypothetical protein